MYLFVLATLTTIAYFMFDSAKSFCRRSWARFEARHPLPAWIVSNPATAYRMACEAHKIAAAAKSAQQQQPSLARNRDDVQIGRVQAFDDFSAMGYTFRGAEYTFLTQDDTASVDRHLAGDPQANILYDVCAPESTPPSIKPFFDTIARCFGPCVVPPDPEVLCKYLKQCHPDVTTADVPCVIVKGTTQTHIIDLVLMQYVEE